MALFFFRSIGLVYPINFLIINRLGPSREGVVRLAFG